MQKHILTVFRFRMVFCFQTIHKPFENNLHLFEQLGSTVPKKLHLFERLGKQLAKMVNPFKWFGQPFVKFLSLFKQFSQPFAKFLNLFNLGHPLVNKKLATLWVIQSFNQSLTYLTLPFLFSKVQEAALNP